MTSPVTSTVTGYRRLPFTLAPIDGESFDSWLAAYAARLQVGLADLATALGLPRNWPQAPVRVLLTGGLAPDRLAAVVNATGLAPSTLTAMFHHAGPLPPAGRSGAARIDRAWAPTPGTRFCPQCLIGTGGRFRLAWRLPFTFLCLDHGTPLIDACPQCGKPPRIHTRRMVGQPSLGRCTMSARPDRGRPTHCRADLADAVHPVCADVDRARSAQQHINTLLDRATCPTAAPDDRRSAIDTLADLTLIASHLARPDSRRGNQIQPHMLRLDTLTTAVDLLTTAHTEPDLDPLAPLVERAARPNAHAVPESWRPASPTLAARIAHRRDARLTAVDRIRYASALPTPTSPRIDRDDRVDPAVTRANRLPDQIWSVWAVRLLADDALDPTLFRTAAAVAVLLPHSGLTLTDITALVTNQISRHCVEHQMTVLAKTPSGTTALRIIAELALAIDDHDIPIDYARRRRLTATTDLIDAGTWKRLTNTFHHFTGSRRRLGFARRYLYELITAGNLAIAPQPYTLPQGLLRFEYHDFVLGLPAGLVDALTEHAHNLLSQAEINDEPLQWHPPAHWVSVTTWPGVDPDQTDPAPVHHALRQGIPASHVTRRLGLSTEHLRHLMRRHPLPGPDQPVYRHAILPLDSSDGWSTNGDTGTVHINTAWLREQYVTWQRTLADIADEVGCTKASLRLFAKRHGIPTRPRSGGRSFIAHRTTPIHPADLPDLLRTALTGQNARQRVERFLVIAEHRNLRQAAQLTGTTQPTLSQALTSLEHQCGGPLIQRGAPRLGNLTPLGNQLREQALHHLAPTATPEPP